MGLNNKTLDVGKIIPRIDASAKATGEEKYAADLYGSNFLWAGVKRAGVPHGRLTKINLEEARSLQGVITILTSKDVKGSNRQGVVRKDQPVLVDDKIRYCGDAVALVVAEKQAILQKALQQITLDIESLPGVFDLKKALEPSAPLVHEDNPEGNILLKGVLETGAGEAAFAECDVAVEANFTFPYQEHAYLETEAGWAILNEEDMLVIVVSTQAPFRDRAEVADALGLNPKKIRIIAPYCGGAFGGKDGVTVQSLLGLAALHCPGRPVKMWWSREESFLASVKRHPAHLYYRLSSKADGTLNALKVQVYYDTGPYDHLGGAVMALGLEHSAGPYRIPNVRLEGWCVYTNNPIAGPFRGFGVPQVTAAMEQTLDMLAAKIGIAPLEIRQRNALKRGDKNAVGVTLRGSTGLEECLDTLAKHPLWKEGNKWKSSARPFKKRGVGLACMMHGMGYGPLVPDYANAKIELTDKGRFRVFSGVVDMGQGNASTYIQIAGDILNQDPEHLELVLPDTEETLPSGSASASRTTYTFGNALIVAAQALKQRILQRSADILMAKGPEEIALVPGKMRQVSTGKEIPLPTLASLLNDSERSATGYFRAPAAREMPTMDENLRLHGIPHLIFSSGVHLVWVEVDELTGAVAVKKYLAVSDCGRVINPQIFEQQIQGGIAQGLGYALCEDFMVDEGQVKTPDLSTYIIPTAMDIPDLDSIPVELHEPTGPFGLKGAGELATDGPLPAIANALANAIGTRIFSSPLTAEKVLRALTTAREK